MLDLKTSLSKFFVTNSGFW